MVTAPNAYWLNFFLKRDINVVCWNYRGYGDSTFGWFDFIDPFKSMMDIERILAFMINNIKLKGKLGAFGRSIGGVTACHIAAKQPELIKLLVIDRSMDEILNVVNKKCRGRFMPSITKTLTCCWETKNY